MTQASPIFDDAHLLKCEMAGEVLRENGTLRLQATGWSMLPAVLPGDTLVIDHVAPERVCQGDIVLFQRDRRLFAHRVTGRDANRKIATRGDSMPQADAPLQDGELLGRITFLVRNGRLIVPKTKPSASARLVAKLVRRSTMAARVVVGIHGIRQGAQASRVVSCQS